MDEVVGMFSKVPRGLIYANLPMISPDLNTSRCRRCTNSTGVSESFRNASRRVTS